MIHSLVSLLSGPFSTSRACRKRARVAFVIALSAFVAIESHHAQNALTERDFLAVWGTASNDVWAVGETLFTDETLALHHFDGETWSVGAISDALRAELFPGGNTERLIFTTISGNASNNVYAVLARFDSDGRFIVRFDGTEWDIHANISSEKINNLFVSPITGSVYFGGRSFGGQTVLRRALGALDGENWVPGSPAETTFGVVAFGPTYGNGLASVTGLSGPSGVGEVFFATTNGLYQLEETNGEPAIAQPPTEGWGVRNIEAWEIQGLSQPEGPPALFIAETFGVSSYTWDRELARLNPNGDSGAPPELFLGSQSTIRQISAFRDGTDTQVLGLEADSGSSVVYQYDFGTKIWTEIGSVAGQINDFIVFPDGNYFAVGENGLLLTNFVPPPPPPPPPGASIERVNEVDFKITLNSEEPITRELWESTNLFSWIFSTLLSTDPESELPNEVVVPSPSNEKVFYELREETPPNSQAIPSLRSGITSQPPVLDIGSGGGGIFALAASIQTFDVVGLAQQSDGRTGMPPSVSVALSTGEVHLSQSALQSFGAGAVSLGLEMVYRSHLDYDGPLGSGWTFNYNETLYEQLNGDMIYMDGSGNLSLWVSNGDGTFVSPIGRFSKLIENPDGTYSMRSRDGFIRDFNANGRLVAMEDAKGNRVELTYDSRGNLYRVTDELGRYLSFAYEHENGRDRLLGVVDWVGRIARFVYNSSNQLASITLVGTSADPDRATEFSYTPEGLLKAVTAPEEVANGGPPNRQFAYDSVHRVISVDTSGTNASGVASGGITAYAYDDGDRKVTITDPNGNVAESHFNEQNHMIEQRVFTRGLRPGEPASYNTTYAYTVDGLLDRTTFPLGNRVEYMYQTSTDRFPQANRVQTSRVPDSVRGGETIVTRRVYEPLLQQVRQIVDPSGHLTDFYFDYQEGAAAVVEAERWGIDLTGMDRDLGDINGDGSIAGQSGNRIRSETTVTKPEGHPEGGGTQIIVRQWGYDSQNRLVRETDPNGNNTTYSYDSSDLNRPTEVIEAEGTLIERTRKFEHDPLGREVCEFDPLGIKEITHYNVFNQVTNYSKGDPSTAILERRNEWDRNGRRLVNSESTGDLLHPAGESREIRYTFDINGNEVRVSVERETGTFITTEYSYDAVGNRTGVVHPEGNQEVFAYDERNFLLSLTKGAGSPVAGIYSYDYDANGNLVRRVDAEDTNGDGGEDEIQYTYDGRDRQVGETDPDGTKTTRIYDKRGNLVSVTVEGSLGDDAGTIRTLSETHYSHDELNRICSVEQPLFQPGGIPVVGALPEEPDRTEFYHDRNSNMIGTSNAAGLVTVLEYDPLDRVVRIQMTDGAETRYAYDPNDNRTRTDERVIETTVGPTSIPERVSSTVNVYDALNRLVTATDPVGGMTNYKYDGLGNLKRVTDAAGNETTHRYDGQGNRIQTDTELGTGPNAYNPDAKQTRTYGYDSNSNLVSVTDDNGETTNYGYDARNQLLRVELPDGGTWAITHDLDGNIATTTDPNGTVITRTYDASNRLAEAIIAAGAGVVGSGSIAWKRAGNGVIVGGVAVPVVGASVEISRDFDSLNRILRETTTIDGVVQGSVENHFDLRGLSNTLNPSGSSVQRERDPLGRLTNLQFTPSGGIPQDILDRIYYGDTHTYLETTLSNGIVERRYNPAGEVSGIDDAFRATGIEVVDSLGNPILDLDFGYNPYGQVDFVFDDLNSDKTDSALFNGKGDLYFQALNALSGGQLDAAYTFTIDGEGNRREIDIEGLEPESFTATIDGLGNYSTYGNKTYTRDGNGSLVSDGEFEYYIDGVKQVLRVEELDTGRSKEMLRDAFGRRVRVTERDEFDAIVSQEVLFYGADGAVSQRWDTVADEFNTGAHWNGQAVFEGAGGDSELYHYHTDANGNTAGVTNEDGDLVAELEYSFSGEFDLKVGATYEPTYRSFGLEYDAFTGKSFTNDGLYDPETGRDVKGRGLISGALGRGGEPDIIRVNPEGTRYDGFQIYFLMLTGQDVSLLIADPDAGMKNIRPPGFEPQPASRPYVDSILKEVGGLTGLPGTGHGGPIDRGRINPQVVLNGDMDYYDHSRYLDLQASQRLLRNPITEEERAYWTELFLEQTGPITPGRLSGPTSLAIVSEIVDFFQIHPDDRIEAFESGYLPWEYFDDIATPVSVLSPAQQGSIPNQIQTLLLLKSTLSGEPTATNHIISLILLNAVLPQVEETSKSILTEVGVSLVLP